MGESALFLFRGRMLKCFTLTTLEEMVVQEQSIHFYDFIFYKTSGIRTY